MRTILLALCLTSVCLAAQKPNVIVVFVDDLGHTDLGCQGSRFYETPHIDKLARDGLRFTTAYSACTVCSPTRAALLTGQYPARLHITDWIEGHKRPNAKLSVPDWTMHLPRETHTIAEMFKVAGYATASIGKWHLGGPEYYPEHHGFDVNIGGTHKGQPPTYFSPFKIPTLKDGPLGEFLSDTLTREACAWMQSNREQPFFLYLPHFAVHTPLAGKPEVIAKYRAKAAKLGIKTSPVYAALVESVDDSVGVLRAKLHDLKLDDNTIILFTSDNGGLIGGAKNPITTNAPFRAGKGSAYEGGVRVPFIAYVPGSKAMGTTTSRDVMTIDIAPTLAAICDLPVPAGYRFDGVSIADDLRGTAAKPEPRAIYWHYPHYHPGGATPYTAMRKGDWRLVEFFEDGRLELYNLKDDVGETKNLATENPEFTAKLHNEMKVWRTGVGAQLPMKNPKAK